MATEQEGNNQVTATAEQEQGNNENGIGKNSKEAAPAVLPGEV
jgi:hypothetical protein